MTIFLSASIPSKGREFFEDSNPMLIREAVVAFTTICMEYGHQFYFGGHPAISPLVYEIACNITSRESVQETIQIYQSRLFEDKLPQEVSYFNNIVFTDKMEDKASSLLYMRQRMFQDHPETSLAVFIGGMNGIIDEAHLVQKYCPKVQLCPIPSTKCASLQLYNDDKIDTSYIREKCNGLETSWFYLSMFRKLLKS